MEQSTTPGLCALLGLVFAAAAVVFLAGLTAHALHRALRRKP